ncbi:MAG: hypothetical protein EBS07_10370 [Sphingobacteriia bacterium]|nr:hypothetical protein [Sphingobacteriia bacterium]
MEIEAKAYKRPTTPVRQRPYIFYRSIQNYTLYAPTPIDPANVITLQPQGNIADGNRVTHGWKIILTMPVRSPRPVVLNVNGASINLGNLWSEPFTLIDTTLDPLGIDSSVYKIFYQDNEGNQDRLNLFVVEQILQISPM